MTTSVKENFQWKGERRNVEGRFGEKRDVVPSQQLLQEHRTLTNGRKTRSKRKENKKNLEVLVLLNDKKEETKK